MFREAINDLLQWKRSPKLEALTDKCNPPLAVRASMSDFRKEEWLTNLPLYVINGITGLF